MSEKINKEVMQEIKMYQAQDYEIEEETTEFYVMTKNTASVAVHVLLALFFWYTCFIPNIIYYFASIKKKKIMK